MQFILQDQEDLLLQIEMAARRGAEAATDTSANETQVFQWISNARAMALLDLSRATMQRLRKSGKLPHTRLGAVIYYRIDDINRMLESNLQTPAAEVAL